MVRLSVGRRGIRVKGHVRADPEAKGDGEWIQVVPAACNKRALSRAHVAQTRRDYTPKPN